mmetsp:Transcript_41868/g.132344  ORF Transcript_41868/g.132344 Transcript_41868/m.132344 type:complete len:383 (-) Transcript_41868:155-1303(-)
MLANVRDSTRISAMALLVRWELGNEFKAYNHPHKSVYALEKNFEQVDPLARRLATSYLESQARISRPHLALLAEALCNESEDNNTRQMACAAICGSGAAAVPYLPAVLATMKHKDLRLRASALRSLGDLGEFAKPHLGKLVRVAAGGRSGTGSGNDTRQAACEGLAAAGDNAAECLLEVQLIAGKPSIKTVFCDVGNIRECFLAIIGLLGFCFCCCAPAVFVAMKVSPWPGKVLLGFVSLCMFGTFVGWTVMQTDSWMYANLACVLAALIIHWINRARREREMSLTDIVWQAFMWSFCGNIEDDSIIKAATDAAHRIEAAMKLSDKKAPPVQHTMSANTGAGVAAGAGFYAFASTAGPDEEEAGMLPSLPGMILESLAHVFF